MLKNWIMSDYTTNATVNLQMNGEEPKKVLDELKKRAFDLQNAIAKAASEGKIAKSRLDSYRSIYRTLKNKSQY